MKHPLISVLIPVYNREDFISEAIESVLNQDFENYELIIVDNSSTDRTWAICQDFADNDPRVRAYRNEVNVGPVKNWSRCLELARGDYCKFLFSDDLLYPSFLSSTYHALQSNIDVGFVCSGADIGATPSESIAAYCGFSSVITSREYFDALATGVPGVPVSPGAALFRTADAKESLMLSLPGVEHDFLSNGAGVDVLMFALTADKYPLVAFTGVAETFFRSHQNSFTVADEGGAVSTGYQLALAWFFKVTNRGREYEFWIARSIATSFRAFKMREALATYLKFFPHHSCIQAVRLWWAIVSVVLQKLR